MKALRLPIVTSRRSFLGTLALSMLAALSGCDLTSQFLNSAPPQCTEPPCQVTAVWQPNIIQVNDSVNKGKLLPGVAGRVYLMGTETGSTIVGDGELVVGLFDDTPRPGATGPVQIHEWSIDPQTLQRLLKKDMFGWGYTVFLPWPEDKPLLTHVQLKVRYNHLGRAPLFGESGPVTLEGVPGQSQPVQVTHSVKPMGQK